MKVLQAFLTLYVFLLSRSKTNGENDTIITLNYTLTTKLLQSISISDSIAEKYLKLKLRHEHARLKQEMKKIESAAPNLRGNRPNIIVLNLYSVLKPIMESRCLLLINNFEGMDTPSTIHFPVILRQAGLAIGHVGYVNPDNNQEEEITNTIWIPKGMVEKLNGNFSKEIRKEKYFGNSNIWKDCVLFEFLYLYWPADRQSSHCLGPNSSSSNFVFSSKPWQCEIQVDLFMPDNLFNFGKYPKTFQGLTADRLRSVPSLRPPVHLLVDGKLKGLEKYNWQALACWTLRECSDFDDDVQDYIFNHVQFSGQVNCKIKIDTWFLLFSLTDLDCIIEKWDFLFPCPECKYFVDAIAPVQLDSLTFEHITSLENSQASVPFPGDMYRNVRARLTLADHIAYFVGKKYRQQVTKPLRNLRTLKLKSSERLQMLGFGYASIFITFMGNMSLGTSDDFRNPRYARITSFMERNARIYDTEDSEYGFPVSIANELGRLHFVSCGSRGTEPFPFLEFLSVFEWKVWSGVVLASILVSITILRVRKTGGMSVGIISALKLLLEQGNPFPPKIEANKHLRFVLTGAFLAGLVISNAFKSENINTIVLPRAQLSYHSIDELIQDNFTLFTRINNFKYRYWSWGRCYNSTISQFGIDVCKDFSFAVTGFAELGRLVSENLVSDNLEKVKRHFSMHPSAITAITDPVHYLDDFLKVGLITNRGARLLQIGNALTERFINRQQKLIDDTLENCTKTAWLLPKYLAYVKYRSLKIFGKHSDVSSKEYTDPKLMFYFLDSYIPSSILKRFSLIWTTGLVEWWPKFVNRPDLMIGDDGKIEPIKPNMWGNILVIFVFLGVGLSAGMTWIVVECAPILLRYIMYFMSRGKIWLARLEISKKTKQICCLNGCSDCRS